MDALRTLSSRPEIIVDNRGVMLAGSDLTLIGFPGPLDGTRLLYAIPTNISGGNLSRRYRPPHPAGENCIFGLSYEHVIPLGVDIASGTILIQTNTVPPHATTDWTIGTVSVRDRALYASLSGGVAGTDYIVTWTATDTAGNIWPRSALVLCAPTS